MGKPTGFMEYQRKTGNTVAPLERKHGVMTFRGLSDKSGIKAVHLTESDFGSQSVPILVRSVFFVPAVSEPGEKPQQGISGLTRMVARHPVSLACEIRGARQAGRAKTYDSHREFLRGNGKATHLKTGSGHQPVFHRAHSQGTAQIRSQTAAFTGMIADAAENRRHGHRPLQQFAGFPQPAAAHGFKHAADIDIKGTEDLTTG